jgi:Protein of unknown function (DUF3768)
VAADALCYTHQMAGERVNHNPIADLNDAFRRSGEGVVATPGIAALDSLDGLLEAVRDYDDFTPDNDPYGEHDMGRLEWEGEDVLWKIDYYDQDMRYWEDPLNPDCQRVLTVMFGSEY